MGGIYAGERDLLRPVGCRALFCFEDADARDAGGRIGNGFGDFVVKEPGEILRTRIDLVKRWDFIQEAVVEEIDPRLQCLFDDFKFDEEPEVVQGFAFDGDLDTIVVSMDLGTLAGVVLKEVGGGKGLFDDDFVHSLSG